MLQRIYRAPRCTVYVLPAYLPLGQRYRACKCERLVACLLPRPYRAPILLRVFPRHGVWRLSLPLLHPLEGAAATYIQCKVNILIHLSRVPFLDTPFNFVSRLAEAEAHVCFENEVSIDSRTSFQCGHQRQSPFIHLGTNVLACI